MRVLRDDSAADFAGGELDGSIIEPQGFVGPIPYLIGGVRTTGINGNHLGNAPDAVTWDELATMPRTGRAVARGLAIDFGERAPYGLQAQMDDVTVLVEAEVFLEEGEHQFQLTANDVAFVEIAPSAGAVYERIATSVDGAEGTARYTPQAEGWHPVRIAFADSDEFFSMALRYDPPGTQTLRTIPVERIRTRVESLDGLMVDAFDDAELLFRSGASLVGAPDLVIQQGSPYDFATGFGAYSLHWAGQILVDETAAYAFQLITSAGQRMWIDGTLVLDLFDAVPHDATTGDIELTAGWHDIVIDAQKFTGNAYRAELSIARGPVTGPIARDHLRPVAGLVGRIASGRNGGTTAVPDGGQVQRSAQVDLPPMFATHSIMGAVNFTHPMQVTCSLTLDPAVGANIVLEDVGDMTGTAATYRSYTIPNDRAGSAFAFILADTVVDTIVGSLLSVSATIVYNGGRPPFEPSWTYTSTVREINATRLGAITWAVRQETKPGSVSVRTCDNEALCTVEEWEAIEQGSTPSAPARRFIQYKVELPTDENTASALDWIQLEYVGSVIP